MITKERLIAFSIWGLVLLYFYSAIEIFYRTLGTREPEYALWGIIPLVISILLAFKYKLGRWIILIKQYTFFLITFVAMFLPIPYGTNIFNLESLIGVYFIYIFNSKEGLQLFRVDEAYRKKEFAVLIILSMGYTALSLNIMSMFIGRQ